MAETLVLAVKMQEIKMKILIADDHALFRDGLSMHLEQIAPDAVISQAGNFSQDFKNPRCRAENRFDNYRFGYAGYEMGRRFVPAEKQGSRQPFCRYLCF